MGRGEVWKERDSVQIRKNSKEKAHHKKRKSKELGEITAREKSKIKSVRKKSREKTRTAEEKDIDTAKEKGKESKPKEKTLEGKK